MEYAKNCLMWDNAAHQAVLYLKPSQTTLEAWRKFSFSTLDPAKRTGWEQYISTGDIHSIMRIREG